MTAVVTFVKVLSNTNVYPHKLRSPAPSREFPFTVLILTHDARVTCFSKSSSCITHCKFKDAIFPAGVNAISIA
jgi:hypothetical protein